ncbi:hypothetical protein [Fimbriimonas ginsengisoli]|uniref:GH16 domain-containing protein n=1 Tax=Fimbriimonas ginsengisoli Gsoil 348 TaxID=661478 RepID=A0A068NNW1_FIMGI|nr:hypothetical protein [Fimbriimonas ginsengisoli]AIE85121.1 hypothetical protein OP10G_1753 [Fimbriimonas ginsengisoli Gsoil 348]
MLATAFIAGALLTHFSPRTIQFSGFRWEVKGSQEKVGPGPNLFSDSPDSVFVDRKGRLHLKVRKTAAGWTCAEVYLAKPLGYGSYTFEVDSPESAIDSNLVLGLFTYGEKEDFSHREIDVELSRWSDPTNDNAQFVVQPYEVAGNMVRFTLPADNPSSTHSFVWRRDKIDFLSKSGNFSKSWSYAGTSNPVPGDETVHINLWLYEGKAPTKDQTFEVILRRFSYRR